MEQQYRHPIKADQPFYQLNSKPTAHYNKDDAEVFIALANLKVSIFNPQKQSFTNFMPDSLHQKRINCLKQKNNILITGSNDCTVKLWDRQSNKLIHQFSKPGSEFNCLDLSQHILSAAHTSKLVFWDLRKMKQRSQFNDSFNGQITSIQFDVNTPTILMGCSVDGMINKFDLKQPNQQQAFEWCTKILESPSKLQFNNNITLVETTNHNMFLLQNQDIKKTILVNNFDHPHHILHSRLFFENNNYNFEYFSWDLERQYVQKYKNDEITGYIESITDSEVFLPFSSNKNVLVINQKGSAFLKSTVSKLSHPKGSLKTQQNYKKPAEKSTEKWKKIQEEEKSESKNGFILNKTSNLKNTNKKFKPY